MQIFTVRSKTLLPRVDTIFLVARAVVLLAIISVIIFGKATEINAALYAFMGVNLLHFVYFQQAVRGRFDIKLAYLSSIIFDLVWVPFMIVLTGNLDSSFYLWYFMVITAGAYVLIPSLATLVTSIATVSYAVTALGGLSIAETFDFALRIGFLWMYHVAILYTAEFQQKSERRLLKLFDTLNSRTAELEKSQARIEVIYENSRALASILDVDDVVKEVMRILGSILQYNSYALVLKDRSGNLFYRARTVAGKRNLKPLAINSEEQTLLRSVIDHGEPVRIADLRGRTDFQPLNKEGISVMIVPMTLHGAASGALVAESDTVDGFKDRDMQLFSIVARSAAMALDNAMLHRQTEELTVVDGLTETYNYRYFAQKLQEEKRRAMRYQLPLSLIMVDIDWFKKLNDSHGHEVGNLVLKVLSRIIKGCIRDVDIFCRYGGEEFAIILPQTGQREAFRLGERIREQVEQTVIQTSDGGKVRITVSVGISSFPENGRSQEELVTIADQALYQAKGEGRNLVCVK